MHPGMDKTICLWVWTKPSATVEVLAHFRYTGIVIGRHAMTEYIDIYTKDHIRTGRRVPRTAHLEIGEYRLIVHVCIFNADGRMLIQKRSVRKKSFGGYWDVSSGGHSRAGETSTQAIHRELREELGVDYDFNPVLPAMTVNFTYGFDDYYLIDLDRPLDTFSLQGEEVEEVRWASREEILQSITDGDFVPFHPSFIHLLFDIHEWGQDFLRT
jgi:isopentenyldiphosphate isomerase